MSACSLMIIMQKLPATQDSTVKLLVGCLMILKVNLQSSPVAAASMGGGGNAKQHRCFKTAANPTFLVVATPVANQGVPHACSTGVNAQELHPVY